MASITCKVVDSNFIGIQGIYAQLHCKDQTGNTIFDYEAFSDEDGSIQYWFRRDKRDRGTPDAEIIYGGHFPVISLSFNPGIREHDFPWHSIHTELRLTRVARHEFILVLYACSGTHYLEHAVSSLHDAQMEWEGPSTDQEMVNTDPRRSPSPLQLPSPIIPPRAVQVSQAGRGVKRKLDVEGEDYDMGNDGSRPTKRRGVIPQGKNAMRRRMTPDSDDSWANDG